MRVSPPLVTYRNQLISSPKFVREKMSSVLVGQEGRIREELFKFVQSHVHNADPSTIDEIVLSYVISVLEDNSFDTKDFCEMISAYYPEFQSISQTVVYNWLCDLRHTIVVESTQPHIKNAGDEYLLLPPPPVIHSSSPKPVPSLEAKNTCVPTAFPTHDVALLQEVFPLVDVIEIRHCLVLGGGDVGRATQLLIDRQEASITTNTITLTSNQQPQINDLEVKNRIIERYSYVDQDNLQREYRPVVLPVEPRKMVRYRDNKIVSLKGERYTEVKKGEDVTDISQMRHGKGNKNNKGHL